MSTQLQLSQKQQSFLSVLLISIFKVLYTNLIGFSKNFASLGDRLFRPVG
jgi:hypothetical protein